MSSIIPGYEYDIFISYRQKDNKYDGWVTEFVDNVRKELEATFKDEISIYFDINPHDGLLETYNVDVAENGFPCYTYFRDDPLLESLHQFKPYNELLKKLKIQWENFRRIAKE